MVSCNRYTKTLESWIVSFCISDMIYVMVYKIIQKMIKFYKTKSSMYHINAITNPIRSLTVYFLQEIFYKNKIFIQYQKYLCKLFSLMTYSHFILQSVCLKCILSNVLPREQRNTTDIKSNQRSILYDMLPLQMTNNGNERQRNACLRKTNHF